MPTEFIFKHINIKIWPWVVSLGWNFQWKEREEKRERERGRGGERGLRERRKKIIKGTEGDKTVPNGWHMFSFQFKLLLLLLLLFFVVLSKA